MSPGENSPLNDDVLTWRLGPNKCKSLLEKLALCARMVTTHTPSSGHKIPPAKSFARGWVAPAFILSHVLCSTPSRTKIPRDKSRDADRMHSLARAGRWASPRAPARACSASRPRRAQANSALSLPALSLALSLSRCPPLSLSLLLSLSHSLRLPTRHVMSWHTV